MERHGIRVDPAALASMSASMENEIRALERCIWELAGSEFNINSPPQLAEILFDKLNLAPAAKRSRARSRSTAADVLTELALLHELPRKVLEYRELAKLKSTYVDALPPADRACHRPPAHPLQPDRRGHRPAQLLRSRICKIFPCAPN